MILEYTIFFLVCLATLFLINLLFQSEADKNQQPLILSEVNKQDELRKYSNALEYMEFKTPPVSAKELSNKFIQMQTLSYSVVTSQMNVLKKDPGGQRPSTKTAMKAISYHNNAIKYREIAALTICDKNGWDTDFVRNFSPTKL